MKQEYDVTQRGYNPKYPKEAYVWRFSKPVPEWLSDRAKVSGFGNNGNPELAIRRRNTGEIEILDSGGKDSLVILKSQDSWVLYSSTHPLMAITPHQMELLYELHFRDGHRQSR